VYHYNVAQWYEQFLQVSRLDRPLILLGLALCLPSISVSSVFMVLYVYLKEFCVMYFALHFGEMSLVGLAVGLVD